MILKSLKMQNKKNKLEKLLVDTKIYSIDETKIGRDLLACEKAYEQARFQRDLKYFLMPLALAVMGMCIGEGIIERNTILSAAGIIALGAIWTFGMEEIREYQSDTGIGNTTTHSKLISEKLAEYEKQLDKCLEKIENLPPLEKL